MVIRAILDFEKQGVGLECDEGVIHVRSHVDAEDFRTRLDQGVVYELPISSNCTNSMEPEMTRMVSVFSGFMWRCGVM